MAKLGDLEVRLLLEVVQADAAAKQYSASLKSVEAETDKVSAKTVTLSDKIQNIGLRFMGFQALVQTLKSTVGELTDDYNRQEVALAKLSNGLRNVGEGQSAINKLSTQASELQKVTPFADEEIQNAQAMLTTFQKNSEQIEILTPRMLDLAAAYMKSGESGMDLQQVAVMMGKVNEETIGGLKRVGVAFSKEQEEKLKSLRGTEQTILLSEVLDQNFKGLAQTIGEKGAGQIAIFKNKVGELREGLGKLLQDALLPVLKFFGPLVDGLANGSETTKRLTLGVLALGTAFVVLGTSMGGLPFILGGIVTLLYSFSTAGSQTTEQINKMNEETLKSQKVNVGMQNVLNDLGISANNMAEAYQNIELSIANMTKTQINSTRLFIQAEKAKVMAVIEAAKTILPKDFVPPDAGKSLIEAGKLFLSPDLNKFDEILRLLDSREKILSGLQSEPLKGGTNKTSTSDKEESLTYLASLRKELEEINNRIAQQTREESEAEGLFIKKKDVEIAIQYVEQWNELIKVTGEAATVTAGKTIFEQIDNWLLKFKIFIDDEKRSKEEIAKAYDRIVNDLQLGANLAQLISQRLEGGGKGFFYWINAAIQAIRVGMSLIKAGNSSEGISFGDILGAIGTILPFFLSSGGSVPGQGTGDTVPAMLTPGEYVLRQSTVKKLGTNFLNWLNQGGSAISPSPGAISGLGGNVIINLSGELTDHLKCKIVEGGNIILNTRRENSIY